jgi:14-3-3 protein epsilon
VSGVLAVDLSDMATFMKKLVSVTSSIGDLSIEERNLLSVAYKNVVGARRASWRTLSIDEHKDNESVKIFRKQIESELASICQEVLDLLKNDLVTAAARSGDIEAQVFYLKMLNPSF